MTGDGSTGDRVTPGGPRPGDRADPTGTVPAAPGGDPDRAAVRAWAGELTTTAAASWLTAGTVTAVGKGIAVAITRQRRVHRTSPTWAQALTGVDPALLTPMSTPPDGWPFTAAVWRRQLRYRLMVQLKYTRWVTYTPAAGSLRVGARGRAWLTGRSTTPTPPRAG